jgi:hypothetical protein
MAEWRVLTILSMLVQMKIKAQIERVQTLASQGRV